MLVADQLRVLVPSASNPFPTSRDGSHFFPLIVTPKTCTDKFEFWFHFAAETCTVIG